MPVGTPSIPFANLNIQNDFPALLADLQILKSCDWIEHVNQADYEGNWSVLALRCAKPHLNAHPILQTFSIEGEKEWVDLPVLEECPAITHLLSKIACPIKSVRLMRLEKGAEIAPHRDFGLGAEHGEARLHLPLETSEQVDFYVAGQRVPMAAGELWYINADEEHSVCNRGTQDRINLVIDCDVNEWLDALIS